jgi:hypothetical protein
MTSVFGNAFYSEDPSKSAWHQGARDFQHRLEPLLSALNLDVRHRVEQVVETKRSKIHAFLRSISQLGRGESGGIRANIYVSDYMPKPVLDIVMDLPDALLWVLLNRTQLQNTEKGLGSILRDYDLITGPGGFRPQSELGREDLETARSFIDSLNKVAVRRAEQIVEDIICLNGDFLGAYFYRQNRIELYWVPIWLVASHLGVAADDLAAVVLVHEMGHLYSHKGQDASHGDWNTDDFEKCDDRIVEGIAQFYTEAYCKEVAGDGDHRQLTAFQALKAKQPPQYSAHETWAPNHRKRAEIVRQALVTARTLSIGDLPEFQDRLRGYENAVIR